VLLSRELVQTPIQIFGNPQIHSHSSMVPNQYHSAGGPK
jgi:hypothetical protein